VKSYLRCFQDYAKYCKRNDVPVLPVNPAALSVFLAAKSDSVTSASTIEVYRSGILSVNGLAMNTTIPQTPWVRAVTRNAKLNLIQTKTRKAPPVDAKIVASIINQFWYNSDQIIDN